MNIGPDHILNEARLAHLPGGSVMNIRRFLVIHFTAGMSAASSIEWWRKPAAKGACAHIVIDRDGTVFQCRPFNRTAGHAGASKWKDPGDGTLYEGLNSCSIGIELANAGDDVEHGLAFGKYACPAGVMTAKHKNGGKLTQWENYPKAQLDACFVLSRVLVEKYNLDDVIGHEDIAPNRKNDPGPAFPMGDLRVACGIVREISPVS